MRKLLVLIHRYAGLAMRVFLILVGLTGSEERAVDIMMPGL